MSTPLPTQQYAAPPSAPAQPTKGSGLAITALVLGVFSLLICLIPILNNAAYFTALGGIVVGIIAMVGARKGSRSGKGMAMAGIVTSVLAIVGAIISTILFVSVLDEVSTALDPKTAASATATPGPSASAGASGTATGDAQGDSAAGPALAVGETATVTNNDEPAADITVSSVKVSAKALGEFGQKPENGSYKIVAVSAKNLGTDSLSVNPFDWYYRDADGNKFEYGSGSIMSGFTGKDFGASSLNVKEQTSGSIVFDVPTAAKELVYAPGFAGEPIAIWKTS